MTEVVQRERFEEFQKSAYLGRLLGGMFGVDERVLRKAEELLEFAVYQTAWNPEQIRQRLATARRVAQQQREARLRDARLMDRVASYSADDETESEFLAGKTSRTKTPGVAAPWKRE